MTISKKPTFAVIYVTLIVFSALFIQCVPKEEKQEIIKDEITPLAITGKKDKYIVDTSASTLEWHGTMLVDLNAGHTGYLDIVSGELLVSEDKLVGGTFQFDMTTMTDKKHGSDNELIRHLKSEDFFEVDKFPLASFGIISVTPENDKTVMIKGSLILKGISQTISFPAVVEIVNGEINAGGEATIDRTRWDIVYKSGSFLDPLADEMISDEIKLQVKIVAKRLL